MSNKPVIIGSGLAGLATAWALAPQECILVTPGSLTEQAASMWAQGGIAAALAEDDSPALHAEDTVRAGAFVGDTRTIRRITDAAPQVVALLQQIGVPFDVDADGRLDLALEGGHSRSRVAHAGDSSGAAITSAMAAAVRELPSVQTLEQHSARRLLTDADGAISGVEVVDATGQAHVIETDAVVLATGTSAAVPPVRMREVATHTDGSIHSVCAKEYASALADIVDAVVGKLAGRPPAPGPSRPQADRVVARETV